MLTQEAAALMQLVSGYWYSQALSVVARLGVADALAAGPKTSEELALACGADAGSLHRLLRGLAAIGLFEDLGGGRFALTPVSAVLRADRPDSLRPVAELGGLPFHWLAWGGLYEAVLTGRPAFEAVHGAPLFEYLDAHPDQARAFHRVMRSAGPWQDAVVEACDLSRFGSLTDVGGGDGARLRAILARYPGLRGVVFDRPSVVEASRPAEPEPRLGWEAGDFFETVPGGTDACLLRFVLHDWSDEEAVRILRSCRAALNPGGRVLVVEHLLLSSGHPAAALLDVTMMVLTGGRERTEDELRSVFAEAGLELDRVTPTPGGVAILEGVPADPT